jgi:hypothetical protein
MHRLALSRPTRIRVQRHFVEDRNKEVAILSYSLAVASDNEICMDATVLRAAGPNGASSPTAFPLESKQ